MIRSNEVIFMTCPNCQTVCGVGDSFCFRCGARLNTQPEKKGSHKVPILILLALSILGTALFFLIPMTPTQSETPWFYMEQGELCFDPSLYSGSSELTVPDQIDGQTVIAIAPHCFEGCTELTTVILPDTVRYIGTYAFAGCTSLRGIYIPESVIAIDARAFQDCTALEAISIPASVTAIGSDTFTGCEKLAHIFYDGMHSQWQALYGDAINLYTHVYCTDGSFLHR
jgi:hypothetical protein